MPQIKPPALLPDTNPALIPGYVAALRATYKTHVTQSVAWRITQVHKLLDALRTPELVEPLLQGLHLDLHKSRFEGQMSEIDLAIHEAEFALEYLHKHARLDDHDPTRINGPETTCAVRNDPYGVVLIASPWNYPIMLSIVPLIGALASGNVAMIRSGGFCKYTSNALVSFIAAVFEPYIVQIVKGSRHVTQSLLQHRFDFIFFTGGPTLGQIYHQAAAATFTPTVLELGGSCPCFVLEDLPPSDIPLAAQRFTWAALVNGGQTCIRPQNLFCAKNHLAAFVQGIKDSINAMYTVGTDVTEYDVPSSADLAALTAVNQAHAAAYASIRTLAPHDAGYKSMSPYTRQSPFFGRIITTAAANRLASIIEADRQYIVYGGDYDVEQRYVEPTVMVFPDMQTYLSSAAVGRGEIFGPIIPIVALDNVLDEALPVVNSGEKPLSLCCFTNDPRARERVMEETSSGSCVINDAVIFLFVIQVPFGGVGASGMGAYHGKYSFQTFSHQKAVYMKDLTHKNDLFAGRYPPYQSAPNAKL